MKIYRFIFFFIIVIDVIQAYDDNDDFNDNDDDYDYFDGDNYDDDDDRAYAEVIDIMSDFPSPPSLGRITNVRHRDTHIHTHTIFV